MKAEKVLVMITVTGLNQLAKAIWKRMDTISPPKMAAVILANRCEGDGVKYLLFAGIVRTRRFQKIGQLKKGVPKNDGSAIARVPIVGLNWPLSSKE